MAASDRLLQSATLPRPTRSGASSRLYPSSSLAPSKDLDVNTVEGLRQRAEDVGLGDDAIKILDEKPKLSFLQRLSKGLGALNPAEAVATGMEKGAVAGVLKYPK